MWVEPRKGVGQMPFPDHAWMQRYARVVNEDAELRLVGSHFTCDFLLDFETIRYLVRVAAGSIREVIPQPSFDHPWAFAIRAPRSVWEKYLRPIPPPLYHHLFAMLMRVPEFRVEGNTLTAAQNIRALVRICDLLRIVA